MTRIVGVLRSRCELLGIEPAPLAVLALDLALLLFVIAAAVRRLEAGREWGAPRRLLASGLVGLALVVGSVTVLGAAGRLSSESLLLLHATLASVVVGYRLRARREGRATSERASPLGALAMPWYELVRPGAWRRARRTESLLLAVLIVVLGFYLVLATFTLPLNYDANTYRLSRIGLWLQHGDIYHFATNDSRQNFTGQNADLAMLWIVSFFRRGYPLVALVQFAAGILACAAVWEICGQLAMSRRSRLVGLAVLVGTPTAGLQFFTAQTDLFAAGSLAAGTAFLLPALRERRAPDWLLVGLGAGLAVGTKATVLYWAPGLALLGLGWAWWERCPPRALGRGIALVALAAFPLCFFNALLNQIEFDQPVAPTRVIGSATKPAGEARDTWLASNALTILWQLSEPESNRWLPRNAIAPWSTALLSRLVALQPLGRPYDPSLAERAEWLQHGLSEDYASFGLLVAVLGVAGGAIAVGRLGDHRVRPVAAKVALLSLAVGFYAAAAWLYQPMTTLHQFRYFCLVAPATAVVAAYALSGVRGVAGRFLVAVVVVVQLASAIDLGLESRHHGWRALVRPTEAPNYPLWAEAREAVAALGARPLDLAVALPRDSWLAPLLRSGVAHRIDLVTWPELARGPCLSRVLDRAGAEALITSERMLSAELMVDVWVVPPPRSPFGRLLVARSAAAHEPLPPRMRATGVFSDGWSDRRSEFEVTGCSSGQFVLEVENATPLARRAVARAASGSTELALGPGERARIELAVGERDRVAVEVTPPFVPSLLSNSVDDRALGLRFAAPKVEAVEGVDGDGWTRTEARFRVAHWYSGTVPLSATNPTPWRRQVRFRSGVGETTLELSPGASQRVDLPVLFGDTVTMVVRPAYLPAADGSTPADPRQLGLLLAAADLDLLGVPH